MRDIQMKCKYKCNKLLDTEHRKLGYFGIGIFWQFSVKMWMFNFGVFNFWYFPKDDCFIFVLFKWLEKNKCS